MKFHLQSVYGKPNISAADGAYLEANTWNDYGFKTLWTLYVVEGKKVREIGGVKIGDVENTKTPDLPERFSGLSEQFFSLGQDEDYYERLNQLGPQTRKTVLEALRDVALDLDLYDQVERLQVTRDSLCRWVKPVAVRTQLHRMALGGTKLSPYSFEYRSASIDREGDPTEPEILRFDVDPTKTPRTNVHVVIGRNGVGKSFMLNDITTALTRPDQAAGSIVFNQRGDDTLANRFANVVSVAYSAFDAFEPLKRQPAGAGAIKYQYIGLKKVDQPGAGPKSHSLLAAEFGKSLKGIVEARRLDRWQGILAYLATDPIFGDCLDRLLNLGPDELREETRLIFSDLSSGHKIVMLTLTRLVETVEEATLVLIDEPEAHLHPPLLASFMNALTELLEDRNGVAIIATHSPVVVQEVPRGCVWKLNSAGGFLTADRPLIETYGENVGTLTQEIFGLEVTTSGFHRALRDAVAGGGNYEDLLARFNDELGAEARSILQAMIHFSRS